LGVKGFDVEWAQVALEGAKLCETDTTNCELSGANGEVTIELPIGETSYTLEKEGYGSYVAAVVMPAEGRSHVFGMRSEEHLVAQYNRVGSQYPMVGMGRILLELTPPFAGATFELINATGKPYYYDEEGNWSPDLTETTSWGWGGFVEVSPGVFQVKLGGTAERCAPGVVGWPGDVEDSIRFPVRAGYTTTAGWFCPPPP